MITTAIISSFKNSFEAFVTKKNKKAVKLGCPEIKFSFGETFFKKIDKNEVEFIEVNIDESAIKLNGWNLIGKIEDVDGSILLTSFGEKELKQFRNASTNHCDHCKTNRSRKVSFIVEKDSEIKQIGSTCLIDFVGHKSAIQYAALISFLENIDEVLEDEGFLSGSSKDFGYEVKRVRQVAAYDIRTNGYTSKAKAEENMTMSTTDFVKSVIFGGKEDKVQITEADIELVEKTLEWFETETHEDSDYFYNCSKIVQNDYVKARYFGYVVSLIAVYLNSQKKKATQKVSNWFGNVGDKKVRVTAKCVALFSFSGNYGYQYMHLFVTEEGNVVKYVTSKVIAEQDSEITFEGTIKAHEEYNGTKQTVFTRCKVI